MHLLTFLEKGYTKVNRNRNRQTSSMETRFSEWTLEQIGIWDNVNVLYDFEI